MNQQEVEQWIADNGGAAALKYSPKAGSKSIPNPNYGKPGHVSDDDHVTVDMQSWTNPRTGATLTVYPSPGGDGYEVDKQVDAPGAQAATPRTPADTASNSPADRALDAEKQREREWNRDNGGLYETHAERKIREANEAKNAEANKPKPISTNTTDQFIVKSDGSKEPNPNYVAPKPTAPTLVDLPTGGKGQLVPDPSTPGGFKVVPVTGTQGPTLPAGIGQFQPDPSKPGYGLFERRQALLDLVAKGTVTEAQVKEILAQDSAMTKSLADQATAVTNGANTAYDNLMTQRNQDITQADARLTSSNTQYSNALSFANQNAVGLARAGTTDIMGPLLRGQTLHAQRNGGLETPDAVALPKALSRYLTMDLPGMGKWAPVSQGVTDQGPAPQGSQPDWGNVPYQTAPDQPAAPTAAPAGPQPPMRDDYSTNTDPSGGGVQAIDSMHPNQQLYQHLTSGDTDPEFAAAVAQHLGVTA